MFEPNCPWCGELLTNPFTGLEVRADDFDLSIEAHSQDCEPYLAEQGVMV